MRSDEREFILKSKAFFEGPNLAVTLTNALGKPVNWLLHTSLPEKYQNTLAQATKKALDRAFDLAVYDIAPLQDTRSSPSPHQYRYLTGLTGALGGFMGFWSIPIELPITTGIMLRSIAQMAQSQGFDLNGPETKLECLYVFSLGGHTPKDDEMQASYYTSRIMFSRILSQGALDLKAAPLISSFLAKVASSFQVSVSEKILAEMIPVVGAVGGASINMIFTNYFTKAANFHFGLRRLERIYGENTVQDFYRESPL